MTLSLAQRVVAIHRALTRIPHAFGGALALAYYAEPRATIDIDLNVFVAPEKAGPSLERLARLGATVDADARSRIERDGQARVFWDTTPLDLFYAYDAFHDSAMRSRRTVRFAATRIPVLDASHLVVCKAVFNRPKDWVDIDAMRQLGADIDAAVVLRWVGRIAGDEDARYERIAAVLTH